MNREFDREIDALLRRHTRAAAAGRVLDDEGAAHSPQSEHLDADEQNAFAENALPSAARSLYVSHLADCAECRHAVAGLARTSNVSVESERKAAAVHLKSSAASARGGWLAALFSPRVLRYAFPALALCLVGVIAFVALRSMSPQQESGQLAQHNEAEADKGRPSATLQEPTSSSSGIGASDDATKNANASVVAGGAAPNQPVQPVEQQAPAQGVLKDTNATGPAPTSPETFMAPPPAPPTSADTQETVGVVAEAAPAPKSVSKEKGEESKMSDAVSREQQANSNFRYSQGQSQVEARGGQPRKVDIDQMPDGSRNTQRNEPQQQAGARANNTLPMLSRESRAENDRAASRAPSRARAAEPRDKREDNETLDKAETTSVSGHRFRRQGGVWVDVKYNNSMRSTGVRRGSEGYRALVADIPELGRIAEQLKGEIVVVIKGRAYRIR